MKFSLAMAVASATLVLTGCPTPVVKNVSTAQPKLVSVGVLGHQICGTFVTGDRRQWNYTCPPLPTTEPTGWQLTPLYNAYQRANHGAIVHVETPSFTELDISFAPRDRAWPVKQIRSGKGSPAPLNSSDTGEVEVDAQDDGSRKIWSKFAMSTLGRKAIH